MTLQSVQSGALARGEELPLVTGAVPGLRSLELAERLRKVESPDTTHFADDFPIFWKAARGSNVEDVDGNRYIDMNAGFGVAVAGHGHPNVLQAIRAQSENLIHAMGDVHPTEVRLRLAEELVQRAPGGDEWKVIFGVTGSDAVEAAMKTAALATGKPGLIAFSGAYHGMSLGSLRATAWPKFREGFEALIPPSAVTLPYPTRGDGESPGDFVLERILKVIHECKSDAPIGAVLIEPILGRGGIVPPPPGFLADLRALCTDRKVLLIFDEIYTGLGRTGAWFACEHEGVVPDMILTGKALGGGLPISVCMGGSEVIDAWGINKGEARHTSTFMGDPLACAAGLALLELIDREALVGRASALGELLMDRLREQVGGLPGVASIRGRGLMVGVEMIDPASGSPDPRAAWSVIVESLKRGVILLVSGMEGNVISLTPPLVITEDQVGCAVGVLAEAIKSGAG